MLERAAAGGPARGPLHDAWAAVDGRVMGIVGTPACPALLRGAYCKVREVAAKQVAIPEKGEKPKLKCSIM